YAFWYPN
nr:[Trp4,Asn7]dermorphin-OH=opioid peptide [Phyllomedusa bicolor=frogs, skin, Peptide, 7 aa] [Phyllomedusa bicolor]